MLSGEAALYAGDHQRAEQLLSAIEIPDNPGLAGRLLYTRGMVLYALAQFDEAHRLLIDAATTSRYADRALARQAWIAAVEVARVIAGPHRPDVAKDTAQAALDAVPLGESQTISRGIMDASIGDLAGRHDQALDLLGPALSGPITADPAHPLYQLLPMAIMHDRLLAFDLAPTIRILQQVVELARGVDAISNLSGALQCLLHISAYTRHLTRGRQALDEIELLLETLRVDPVYGALIGASLKSVQATDTEIAADLIAINEGMKTLGIGALYHGSLTALLFYCVASGDYQRGAEAGVLVPHSWSRAFVLPNLVVAATRTGDEILARETLAELQTAALRAGAPWATGILARSQALLADDENAEELYLQCIAELAETNTPLDLGRGHLVYGEWLRRQRRRTDATTQLQIALSIFGEIGAVVFAGRAQLELNVADARARRRTPDNRHALTPPLTVPPTARSLRVCSSAERPSHTTSPASSRNSTSAPAGTSATLSTSLRNDPRPRPRVR